ncbi:MAG: exodeoxyribonuclease VII large subunit [Clostridia bacterium]|nr:exodeoxyribonuclease VII large subunit [Clostridia bacterium]
MALRPITVTQLNEYIARVFESDVLLMDIAVTGEITNLKHHSSGHVYFSITDENSKINCFLASSYASALRYELADGLKVIVTGKVNVYKKGGYYSIFVRSLTVSGEGDLAVAFELMKEKLAKEGLFSPEHKKELPAFPRKLGILTSDTGAAVRDIIKIIRQRNELVDIYVFPVKVQGEGAAEDIASTLDRVNEKRRDIDVLIVGRGGGSREDLWAFNEEVLARAIYRSEIPVISAVGHEIDFSISDFVADRRAETPTAAAEMAVPDIGEMLRYISDLRDDLQKQLSSKLRYDSLRADNSLKALKDGMVKYLDDRLALIEKMKIMLEGNDPYRIMERGYSVIEDREGKAVASKEDLKDGEYDIVFRDGKVRVRISHV